jgi:hypothetical protein
VKAPVSDLEVRITADTSEATAALEELRGHLDAVSAALERARALLGEDAYRALVEHLTYPMVTVHAETRYEGVSTT